MSQTIQQKTNAVGFPKPGEIIEITGAHELEASDRSILNILYQHAHDSGRLADEGTEWEIELRRLRSSRHESNDRIRDSLDRLMRVVVNVPYKDEGGSPRELKTHLFDFFDAPQDETANAVIRFGLPRKLQPIIVRSGRWGRIKAEVVCTMASRYSIALYEMVQLRASMEKCTEAFTIDRFRELMGVPPGKLDRGPDFMRRVIEPAVTEVNGLSEYSVAIEPKRNPRGRITDVTVVWWPKTDDEYRAVLKERQRPKFGRAARLRGNVEPVA